MLVRCYIYVNGFYVVLVFGFDINLGLVIWLGEKFKIVVGRILRR